MTRGSATPEDQVRVARAGAALFPRGDAGLVVVTGADRVRWLDGMLSNDVARLEPGPERSGCPALLLTRKGRIVADPHVLLRPDALWLAVARDAVPAVIATLDRFIVADRVELSDGSDAWDRLALEGPAAPSLLESAAGAPPDLAAGAVADAQLAGIPVVVAAFGVTPTGRHLFAPAGSGERASAALLAAGATLAGAEALEILRIEEGLPRLYAELDDDVLPAEAGLDGSISATKGCYTGQEIVARLASRGRVNHRLVGLVFDVGVPPSRGDAIRDGTREVGEITSACVSPGAGAIALGFVRATRAEPGTRLDVAGLPARVAPLPFADASP